MIICPYSGNDDHIVHLFVRSCTKEVDMSMKNPVHPGKIIRHSLEAAGMTVTEAAKWLGVTRPTLSRVLNGKSSVSPEMAVRISKAVGSTPEHWLRMQLAYDISQMRDKAASINVRKLPDPHLSAG
jgi:addiction module HigA family antidote